MTFGNITGSNKIGEYNQVHMLSSTFVCSSIEKSARSSTLIHSFWTRYQKKKYCYAFLFNREERRMSSGSSCRKEKNILAAKFYLLTTIIIWSKTRSQFEASSLEDSWLASKALTSARRRLWERRQRKEKYRTFSTHLFKKSFSDFKIGRK